MMEQQLNPLLSSESVEHGTPAHVVELAHKLWPEGIDLDPASSPAFNVNVRAKRIFTREDNGLAQRWDARTLWLNPPGGLVDSRGREVLRAKSYGQRGACTETGSCGLPPGHRHEGVESSARVWWTKLMMEWDVGRTEEALFIGYSLEILQRTQTGSGANRALSPLRFALCVPRERLRFLAQAEGALVSQDAPTHANFVCYIGPRFAAFRDIFSALGDCIG